MTGFHQSDSDEDQIDRTGTPSAYKFDCAFCDDVLQSTTAEAIKDGGTSHLAEHKDQLLEIFAERGREKRCENDCGYVFSEGIDEISTFECPRCGHDNFQSAASRYLYWRIEQLE